MKKILAFALIVGMMFAFAACTEDKTPDTSKEPEVATTPAA